METVLRSFLSGALSYAGQMAYAEEAAGTFALLENLSRLFRYLEHAEGAVELGEELRALRALLEILRLRYPDRALLAVSDPPAGVFVRRFALIRFVVDRFIPLVEEGAEFVGARLAVHCEDEACLAILDLGAGTRYETCVSC